MAHLTDMAADYVFAGNNDINFEVPGTLGVIYNYKKWKEHKKGYPFLTISEYLSEIELSKNSMLFMFVLRISMRNFLVN